MNNPQRILDKFSIGASLLCAAHCVALPLILALFPAISATHGDDHHFHEMLVWLVLPASVIAASLGCARHKDWRVVAGVALGLLGLVFTALWGHDLLGETGEKVATVAASFVLALAHWRNFRLCQADNCDAKQSR